RLRRHSFPTRRSSDLDAVAATHYLQIQLARPVPDGGEVRIRIHKTYKDTATYHRDAEGVVFSRGLTVRRDAVVLPKNFEIVGAKDRKSTRLNSSHRTI